MEEEGFRFCNKRLICMCTKIPEPWGSERVSASKQRQHRVASHTVPVVTVSRGVCVSYGYACQWDFAWEHETEIWIRSWEASAKVAIHSGWILKISGGLRFGCWRYQGSKLAAGAITGSWGRILTWQRDSSWIYILNNGFTGRSDPRATG